MTPFARRAVLPLLGASLLPLPGPVRAAEPFDRWLAGVREDAARAGIGARTIEAALGGIRPIDRVIELDRRQPEGRMSFAQYRQRVISAARIEGGTERLSRHADLLRRVRDQFGVPPQVIVALWGIESNFGNFPGRFPVIDALATLAWDGRRAGFFRKELMAALKILDRGEIAPSRMYGSWAGAMGQSQFMPTTYLGYAVDLDGDGRRDIWDSLPDVFGSMANYLARAGWDPRYLWGREVRAPREAAERWRGLETRASLIEWQSRGIRATDGGPLPDVAIEASLLRPDHPAGPTFLVYNNFRTLMVWNRSTYFALSVGLLADRLVAASAA
jgi:membrane-bound lytic murein transglycosylase B